MNNQMQHSIKVLKGMTARFPNAAAGSPEARYSEAWREIEVRDAMRAAKADLAYVATEFPREQDGNPAYVWEKIQREREEISLAEALTNRTE